MSTLQEIGQRLTKPPAEFRFVRHIEYLEGPLISEFQVIPDGEPYLFIWRARSDLLNRWLVIRTSKRMIALFENLETTLRLIMDRAVQAFLADANSEGKFVSWHSVVIEQLPANYLSANDSFYDPDLRPRFGARRGQAILIEGNWDLTEIAEYPRRYRDVYAAEYLLSSDAKQGSRKPHFDYLMNGGYVYNTFFTQLANSVPQEDQARVKVLQYSSPGIIVIDVNQDVAAAVNKRVTDLIPVIDVARETYNELHRWQREVDRDTTGLQPDTRFVEVMLNDLVGWIGFIDLKNLLALTGDFAQALKIVLACFRRINTLVQYQESGKARLVSEKTEDSNPEEEAAVVEDDGIDWDTADSLDEDL